VREYELLDHEARFSLRSTKHSVAPKGIEGGSPGKTGKCTINPGTDEERVLPARYSDLTLHPCDVIRLETPGGGGLGNPLERDPLRVLNDVRNGYVSPDKTKEIYGVVLEKSDGDFSLNEELTRKQRERQ
jgi:N-methylhydantoinase B